MGTEQTRLSLEMVDTLNDVYNFICEYLGSNKAFGELKRQTETLLTNNGYGCYSYRSLNKVYNELTNLDNSKISFSEITLEKLSIFCHTFSRCKCGIAQILSNIEERNGDLQEHLEVYQTFCTNFLAFIRRKEIKDMFDIDFEILDYLENTKDYNTLLYSHSDVEEFQKFFSSLNLVNCIETDIPGYQYAHFMSLYTQMETAADNFIWVFESQTDF